MENTITRLQLYNIMKNLTERQALRGFDYVIDTILMIDESNNNNTPAKISAIYSRIAENNQGTTPYSVERNIRHLIVDIIAGKDNNPERSELFKDIMGNANRITNKDFCASLIRYIKLNPNAEKYK